MNRAWEMRKGKCVFNLNGMCHLSGEGRHRCIVSLCPLTEKALKEFVLKGYQLQMWEIVQKKVKAYQSDILYDVQVIAQRGEDRKYLWLVREYGTHIYKLPLNRGDREQVKYLASMYEELEGYVIYPVKDIVMAVNLKSLIRED
ncbi:hypothetical protein J7M02_07780 [Candidatus Aerophobetes bacterium]|nr:hypothetical protein [Candidatus Aerophobetes bacterium]